MLIPNVNLTGKTPTGDGSTSLTNLLVESISDFS